MAYTSWTPRAACWPGASATTCDMETRKPLAAAERRTGCCLPGPAAAGMTQAGRPQAAGRTPAPAATAVETAAPPKPCSRCAGSSRGCRAASARRRSMRPRACWRKQRKRRLLRRTGSCWPASRRPSAPAAPSAAPYPRCGILQSGQPRTSRQPQPSGAHIGDHRCRQPARRAPSRRLASEHI